MSNTNTDTQTTQGAMTEEELSFLLKRLENSKETETLPSYTIQKLTEAVVGIFVSQTVGWRESQVIKDLMRA